MLAEHGNARLHFDRTGDGPPVLLVMGLGLPGDAWWRTIPVLAGAFEVISFDNRGSGRSDRPAGPLSIADMAADAVAVLDAAGIARAHVYGMSMGGMIAQELALRHPDRVGALVLGATTAGGRGGDAAGRRDPRLPGPSGVDARRRGRAGPRCRTSTAIGRASRAATGSARTSRTGARTRSTPTATAPSSRRACSHDTGARLGSIAAPVLVVHGAEDRMVPPANGRALAAAIPGAELAAARRRRAPLHHGRSRRRRRGARVPRAVRNA